MAVRFTQAALLLAALLPVIADARSLHQASTPSKCEAVLEKWAMLPAKTFVPFTGPDHMKVSGKFTGLGNYRNNSIPFCAAANPGRCTDVKQPNEGQPVQGLSGIRTLRGADGKPTGSFLVISDNGFGNKKNSADAALMWNVLTPNWEAKTMEVTSTTFLKDTNKAVRFPIQNEADVERHLTGADFDVESIQPIGDEMWIGDEFGPYLLNVGKDGEVKGVYPMTINGSPIKSPDHDTLVLPNPDGALPSYNLKRSKGLEGMAQSPDGAYLYPLLEGALYDPATKAYEADKDGKQYLRIFKFDVAAKTMQPYAKYRLEDNSNAIGDFNMITADKGMIIERDNGEGDIANACAAGAVNANCFEGPAKLKRVYLIDFSKMDAESFVSKEAYIDLLDIKDPNGVSPYTKDGVFTFPFVTIEDVDVFSAEDATIVVGNDNNFPGSMGRALGKADDNEIMVLKVPGFFGGKC